LVCDVRYPETGSNANRIDNISCAGSYNFSYIDAFRQFVINSVDSWCKKPRCVTALVLCCLKNILDIIAGAGTVPQQGIFSLRFIHAIFSKILDTSNPSQFVFYLIIKNKEK
jgi:hypothetical protein